MQIIITCRACNGTGKRRLDKHLMKTFALVPEDGEATATAIHSKIGDEIGITAINNRLNDLVDLGLLQCRKSGKQKFYRVVQGVDYIIGL